jgi:signal transduction histidine kinase
MTYGEIFDSLRRRRAPASAGTGGKPGQARLARRFFPLLVLALGAAASVALFFFTRAQIDKEAKLRFERQASDARHAIEARVISYLNVLYGLAALFDKPGGASRAEFRDYTAALNLSRRYPGIRALNYAEHVVQAQKARFEERVQRDTSVEARGYPDFAIWPPGDRPEYEVLVYVEPFIPETRFAFGLDIANNPRSNNSRNVRQAIMLERDTGEVITSGQRLNIGQGADAVAFGMRLAVYRHGTRVATVEERRAAYLGSVGLGIVVKDVMRGVVRESTLHALRFKLYDGGSVRDHAAGISGADAAGPFFDSLEVADSHEAFFETMLPLEVAGRIWEIRFGAPRDAFVAGSDRALPWLALASGLMTSLLLFVILESIGRSARRVESARREAEAANLAKTKFLAAASHDLRQPLQALSMYVSVLEARVQNADALPVVQGINLSVRTLEQLFDGLLDISKIESGVIKPNVVAFELMPLIDQIVEAERPLATHKKLELRVVRTSASVRSDPLLLGRMLKNLVTNAIRYTEHGRIIVGCRRLARGRLRIQVVDSGIGISPEEQERVFEEYYQVSGESAQGLGLGLPIVKSLGELLGHPVVVSSVQGRGSVFAIELDRVASVAAPSADFGVSLHGTLTGVRVTLVDDDAEIRNSMRLLLESWGARCIEGATAMEVETKLRAQELTPDALIVDYRLADSTTGFEAIERLRAAFGSKLPALVITGTANVLSIRERALDVPIATKPIAPGKLRAFLAQSVKKRTGAESIEAA